MDAALPLPLAFGATGQRETRGAKDGRTDEQTGVHYYYQRRMKDLLGRPCAKMQRKMGAKNIHGRAFIYRILLLMFFF